MVWTRSGGLDVMLGYGWGRAPLEFGEFLGVGKLMFLLRRAFLSLADRRHSGPDFSQEPVLYGAIVPSLKALFQSRFPRVTQSKQVQTQHTLHNMFCSVIFFLYFYNVFVLLTPCLVLEDFGFVLVL